MKKSVKVVVGVLLGNVILALAVAGFALPHNMIMGGATGIGITVSHYTGIDISILI